MTIESSVGSETRNEAGELIRRSRGYVILGKPYAIIKYFPYKDYVLWDVSSNCIITVEGMKRWGAGLRWEQAERIVEKRLKNIQNQTKRFVGYR